MFTGSLPFNARLRIAVLDFLEDAALAESVLELFLKTLGVESTEHIEKYFEPRKEFEALKLRHVQQANELKTFLLKRLRGGSQKAKPQQKAPPVQEANMQSWKRTAPPSAREENPPSGASRGLMANWMVQGASKKLKPDKPDKPNKPDKSNKPLIRDSSQTSQEALGRRWKGQSEIG
uniref:Uncharacterized protein n=1 Tax=Chromera velia CCMP2878 TaxID=1169474 RepID=A0A0G4GDU9_9ALVE|eukprot:Cvel_21427.t1-p1 / transcript=Cvel_21427.t1 / gene=Cvel_21427 / organism=Chromera_velia_CCMP2878 / gene_product=hypothetical protein / transcript_product=hypothetical protein / location=Cvel_scaffold2008:29786-30477(-) / protein_length=176 / sequence_SO=supercontig / SO=protein_coding / is_pseudo=false